MKHMEELKEMLCDELEEITSKGQISAGDLDAIDKLTHSIKSIETIMAMGEYSHDGSYEGSSYNSYARDGRMRDSMGRYSRRGYSRRNYRDGYSYGKEGIREELEDLMNEAGTEREKQAIRMAIEQM